MKFKIGDVIRKDYFLGEVTKVDYIAGFDEVWVTFDGADTEQCFGSKDLLLVANVADRKDLN